MIAPMVILLSLSLQLAAAGFALRIRPALGRPLARNLIAVALLLMAGRRVYSLAEVVSGAASAPPLPQELLGLAISALMLVGILLLRGSFRTLGHQAAILEEARARARLEADKLEGVMAAIPVPIWIAEDPECRSIRGNPAAAALLGLPLDANHSASAPLGERPAHFRLVQDGRTLAPEDMPMQRAVFGGLEVRGEPLDLVFDDGQVHHLMAYATPLRDAKGRVRGGVCCLVDLTEVRQAEEALAKAHKMESLGLLAGGLAHDFNNIFQAMVTHLEMAEAALPAGARAQAYLDRLRVSLDRATGLSRDILHCSGGDLRRPESVDLSSLVAEALDRLDQPLTRDLASLLPRVMMDPLLVGRVVEGLVTNALEASSAAPGIRVRTSMRQVTARDLGAGHWPEPVEPGLYAVLEVSDQGHGIDAATLPRIFDPFFSTRDMGRGLGLPAALGILRSHRGGIQVESIPGVGSVFRVHFPCPESLEPPPEAPAEGGPARGLVLLADDEAELRSVMAEMLRDWFGLEVATASDGQEALEHFSRRPDAFDLVILDATMPRLGGVEAFRAMRQFRPGLPGILFSGYALPTSRDEAVAQGFADFLRKPFTSAELGDILDRVLGARKA